MNVARTTWIAFALLALGWMPANCWAQAKPKEALKPIEIAAVKHEGPVDFEKEILPIFRRNCLACHSATEAQSDLTLETPATILKGGSEGPSVVAGKSAESLLLKLAARQKEPVMPPPDNDVKAKPLTSQELGLIKLWIDEGAKGEVKSASANITWQPLPPGVNPIYAVALTSDGQYAAVARANQIFLYHIPSKRELGRLTDPELMKKGIYTSAGVADLDLIQSLKFSPDNKLLASGGFRTVKLWRKPEAAKALDLAGLETAARSLATSVDGKWAAIGEENGKVRIFEIATGKVAKTLEGHSAAATGVAFTADSTNLVTGSQDKTFRVWNIADQKELAKIETPAPVNAVALVAEGKQIAAGGADNIIRLYALPDAQPAEAPKPLFELTGHTQPVTSLATIGTGATLLSGSKDGNLKIWDVATGKATAKPMAHGTPIESIAVRADGKRFVSVSSNNTARIWNADDQKQVAEMKGDLRATLKAAEVTRAVALAKKHVDLAKGDLTEATKRKTAEEENQKKSKEAVKTSEEDFKKKEEAAKAPTKDKEDADKALAEATEKKTKADEAKKVTDEAATKAAEAFTKATADRDAAAKVAKDAEAELKKAQDAQAKAKEAADKDAANEDLKKALAAAEATTKEVEGKNKTAVDAKAAADKVFTDQETAKKAADEAKKVADKSATDAMTAFTQAEAKVKTVMVPFTKAVDERNAADRTFKAAQRSVERADEAVKKATEAVPAVEKIVKDREEDAKKVEAELATATKAVTESEKPFKAAAFSPDGSLLAVVGDDQLIHTYASETGAAVEVFGGGAPLAAVAFASDARIVIAAAANTAQAWDLATEWKLERTIGSADMGDKLVDRVTALDFSPDGKTLATGGGEPSRSGEIKLWDVATGNLKLALKEPHSDTVFAVDFSPNGEQLASCGADRFVKLFNVADGKFVRSFEGHTHHVLGVTWRADGRLMASSGADNVIKVWDTRTGDQARTVQNQFTKEVTTVSFVGETDNVIASSGDSKVKFINAASGGSVRDFPGAADYMYSAAASADGKTIIAGGADSVLRVWTDAGTVFATFEAPKVAGEQTAAK
ncbi:Chromosome partition protein Smc [Anatilimnocola aggregata]|uniref:Chromosome partition protein Smc n=1 Tax=Anatilimnocola aggregata TaxID=2528021 RepID=A0A517Y6E1_9BACT|nr:c-type cytochrome domain-containing protein [Anatilimnocola aggregata]QDU25790.1 Chromosome partition protein Smc [Anatilimnocola aggregata]